MRDRIFLWLSVVFLSTLAVLSQTVNAFSVSPVIVAFLGAKRLLAAFASAVVAKLGVRRLGLSFLNYETTKPAAAIQRQRAERPQFTAGWRLCSSI